MLGNLHTEQRIDLTQAELNAILSAHEHYLAHRGGRRAKVTLANLDGLNLANRNLAEADFSGASLVGANAFGSNLQGANFYCADLRDCNFTRTNMKRADLRGASVKGARLAYAILDKADVRKATMMYIGPNGVRVINRNGGGQSGAGVDFSNCSLKGASFAGAEFDGANFTGAILHGVNFQGAKLKNATFKNAVLTGVNLKELAVPPSALAGCVTDVTPEAMAKGEVLKRRLEAHQIWLSSGGAQPDHAVLDGEDLRPLQQFLMGRRLAGLSMRRVVAVGVDFSDCWLQGTKFDGADLRDANFSGADMRGASLRNVRLVHAKFERANLQRLSLFDGAALAPDLTGADAIEAQFSDALLEGRPFDLGLTEAVEAA